MIKYAITGNIASGKTEMEKILQKNGFTVFDTDTMTHDILLDKPDVPEAFKEYDIFEYGKLSREKLSNLVFNNSNLRKKLEDIVHPLIIEELETVFKVYADEKYIFVSVPLLFEAGWEKMFDKIVFISCRKEIELKRLMRRNGLSKEAALKRINSQKMQNDKILKSDVIIENNSSICDFHKKISEFINTL